MGADGEEFPPDQSSNGKQQQQEEEEFMLQLGSAELAVRNCRLYVSL